MPIQNLNHSGKSKAITTILQDEARYLLDSLLDRKAKSINYFLVGKYLKLIKDNYFTPVGDFFNWLEDEYELESRKARYIMAFFTSADKAGITSSQLENTGMGWTKLTAIGNVLSIDNLNHWLEMARNLPVKELTVEVKKAKMSMKPEGNAMNAA